MLLVQSLVLSPRAIDKYRTTQTGPRYIRLAMNFTGDYPASLQRSIMFEQPIKQC